MSATDLVKRLIAILNDLVIPYMLVGSYSSNYYGRPRATQDADFVLVVSGDQLKELARRLGPEFKVDPQVSFETVTMTMRHIVHHPATTFKIELFLLSDDAHDQERFARRRVVDFEGMPTAMASAEDVVVTKLRWSRGGQRSKDLADVAEVLATQRGRLDLDYVRSWCDRHGTREVLERLLAATPSV